MVAGIAATFVLALFVLRPVHESSVERLSDQAQVLKYTNHPGEAVALLKKAIEDNTAVADQILLRLRLGTLYESEGKCQDAIKSYRDAESISPKPIIGYISGIARCSDRLGNVPVALDYYRKAYALVDRGVTGHEADLAFYKQKIISLGGSL